MAETSSRTVLDALLASLKSAAQYNHDDQVAPLAVLWTDKGRQWESLMLLLRDLLPGLLTLGDYDPAIRTGPAIWIRCMIGRTLPEANWPPETTPVIYMPGVSRQDLRAIEDCPRFLHPLAGIQYSCTFWSQKSAKDWTITAFLGTSEGGLDLSVARDSATAEAAKRALPVLAEAHVLGLRGKVLDSSDFNALLAPDTVKNLLHWMNDPTGMRKVWSGDEWAAFRSVCKAEYDFDPQTDGELVGAEKLGRREGKWSSVWDRFAESPKLYAHLPPLLRQVKPEGLFIDRQCWPQFNEDLENVLRSELTKLKSASADKARLRVGELETENGLRRGWVWARLGLCPLAEALDPLSKLAAATTTPAKGSSPENMAKAYIESGWKADAAAIDAMAAVVSNGDVEAVKSVIGAIYRPWLQECAERFQELVARSPLPNCHAAKTVEAVAGRCILFADGLRYDVAQRLSEALRGLGLECTGSFRWVAMPSVTPTAKPAVSPVSASLCGNGALDFRPAVAGNGELTTDRFAKLMKDNGIQVLSAGETGDPTGKAWAEAGQIDRRGHDEGWKLAHRIEEEVAALAERIGSLLQGGWQEVQVVTDHGWLLLPGGLPSMAMPAYLTETRWGRCAVLKGGNRTDLPTTAWYWDGDVTIALAPGINCFRAGMEYAHGSLSLQECVIPQLIVKLPQGAKAIAKITEVRWVALRCKVAVDPVSPGLRVDIRSKAADAGTSMANNGKVLGNETVVSLVVPDDSKSGQAALVVLVCESGSVVAKLPTIIGGQE